MRSPAPSLDAAGFGTGAPRLVLHFGAVDHRARVWIDGQFVGGHEGGHTPFSFDVTEALAADPDAVHTLVVRAEDDPHDLTQPRGKQDWHEDPHAIWYRRTTGIWQTVWLEAVPTASIASLRWTHVDHATVSPGVSGSTVTAPAGSACASSPLGRARRAPRHDRDHRPARPATSSTSSCRSRGRRTGRPRTSCTGRPSTPRLIDATVTLLPSTGNATAA